MRRLLALLATPAGRIARYVFSLALLGLLARQVDWSQLAAARDQLSLPLILPALLLSGLAMPVHGVRWWLIFRAQGLPLSVSWAQVVIWIGQFYNAFLVGGLGGDAARVFYLLRDAPAHRAGGLLSLVLDRAIGLSVLLAMAAIALVTRGAVLANTPGLRWLLVAAIAIPSCTALAVIFLIRLDPARWPAPLARLLGPERLATAARLIGCVRAAPWAHAGALTLGGLIWTLEFVAIWLLARAVGLPLPFLETCIAVSVATAATALPISVGGHGVREGALLATFAAFGLLTAPGASDRAALLALLVWAATIFWSLTGGLFVLVASRLLPPPAPASRPPV